MASASDSSFASHASHASPASEAFPARSAQTAPDGDAPAAALLRCRVVRVDRGSCLVLPENDEAFRAGYREAPAVGDVVDVRRAPGDPDEIVAVLPRRSAITRGAVGRDSREGLPGDSHAQVLAANVDVVYIAEPATIDSTGSPEGGPNLGRIERLLAIAWESGARPVVVITKVDLVADPPALLASVEASAPGAEVHLVSSFTGAGLPGLAVAPGETAVLLGPSGAGKSTLMNALAGEELMRTGEVRASDGRGRHTTSHRELFELPGGGVIIDTPGLRRIGLYDVDAGLSQAFSDIEELAEDCRFSDCAHGQEPGCAVLAAVESGDLPQRRLDSWHKLRREADWMARRGDARLQAEHARQWKIIHKEMRRTGRARP